MCCSQATACSEGAERPTVKRWEEMHPMLQGKLKGLTLGALHFGETTAKTVGPCLDNSSESFPVPTSDVHIIYDDVISLWKWPYHSCWGKKQALCGDPVVLAMRGDVLTPGAEGLHPDQWVPSSVQRCCGPGDTEWCPSDSRCWGAAPWPAGAKFLGQRYLSIHLVMFNKWNNLVLCLS